MVHLSVQVCTFYGHACSSMRPTFLLMYLRFKAAESSHGVSLPTLPFRPVLERSSGDVGRFEALRRIFSTGTVPTAPQFEWAYRAFSDRLAISSGSGGTDICCCCERPFFPFLIRFHIIRSRVCYPFTSSSGMAGELVCTRPHPSTPLRFWGDDSHGTRFLKAYYDTYPGVWHHGDFIAMNPHTSGYIIFGRRFKCHINSVPYFMRDDARTLSSTATVC
jgi:hypothetical protein